LTDFLIIVRNLTVYTKKDIDKGQTPSDIYKICSIIRETFCLSYAIRKQNNLFIFMIDHLVLLKFEGKTLRYLGPDERSQALLVLKAIDKLKETDIKAWRKSTPGIYYRTFDTFNSFIHYFQFLRNGFFSFIFTTITAFDLGFLAHTYDFPRIVKLKSLKDLKDEFFILSDEKNNLLHFLRKIVQIFPTLIEQILLIPLKKVKKIEDKILYVNFQIDQQQNSQ